MHELAVCQELIAQVEVIAQQHHAKSINSVTLKIGPLAGVEGDLLKQAFPIACAGTVAEGAKLITKFADVVVYCDHCKKKSTVPVNKLLCSFCGDWKTKLISGDELLLLSIDMEK